MYLMGLMLWIAVSGILAWLAARVLTARTSKLWVRWLLTMLVLPFVFIAPLADEIIGKFQFDRLCEEAKEVKIHATHPVGEDLYTPEGIWRRDYIESLRRSGQIGDGREEDRKLRETYESLLRWDHGSPFPEEISAAIPIRRFSKKIFDRSDGRMLAEWHQYGTPGGWVSRNFETPFLVRSQCIPDIGRQLDQRILPFRKSQGAKK